MCRHVFFRNVLEILYFIVAARISTFDTNVSELYIQFAYLDELNINFKYIFLRENKLQK
jgi:hypothetical protein